MKRLLLLTFFFVATIVTSTSAISAETINGLWWNQEKTAQIEIYEAGGRFFGKIVFLKEPLYPADDPMGMAGRTKVDRKNPDPLKRNHAILGLQILNSFRKTGERLWEDGSIYDPKNGKTYRCKMTLEKGDALAVRGFIGFSLLGRTETWTRVK